MSVRLIKDVTGISKSQVHRILNEDLKLRKVCAQFVPHSLNDDQKHARVLHAQDIILTANNDPKFLKTIVAGDEAWCFQYKPLTKRQSAVWKSPEDSPPRKGAPAKIESQNHALHFLRPQYKAQGSWSLRLISASPWTISGIIIGSSP